MKLEAAVAELTPSLLEMRRDFHRHPELGFQEFRTSAKLAEFLRGLGLEVTTGVAQTGVVARLMGAKPGKTVLVRADIDALPIQEETGAAYASQTPGVMHACGHDGHAAVGAHVAALLARMRDQIEGEVRFAFQPAEEIVSGARPMVEAGVLEGVDAVVGLHLNSQLPAGKVGVRSGPSMAAADAFTLTVRGKGTHAAMPHMGVDTVAIAAHIILGLQTLVSRETDPISTAVITIATVTAGDGAHNIIPEVAVLKGTLRTFDPVLRDRLIERIEALSKGIAAAMNGGVEIAWRQGSPAVVNDAALTERFRAMAQSVVGQENLLETPPVMGGDDMAEFLLRRPGVYFWVGAGDPASGKDKPHHHPGFDIDDERALPIATKLLAQAALEFLR
ncbi:M20 metallopeptidase family protein [Meiothermus granaticius]|uniref:Putative hydrolase YxeP n=1 Tax=Meiothermus granaticius NBRC 107808 TaxID=1227551 RepID=A0A399FA80_9DEIN|nr:amidohydrolase [Meiothermus granaticius]RIH92625.1 putative hydrolase YxeP [Meiothermus granaticius NBRC 107808]GEM87609.1 amidohydrolase [Meiothermus granaticius NBRC 107808]